MADGVTVLRVKERTCSNCENAYFGSAGVFCRLFEIDVWNETKEAAECEDFTPH